MIGINNGIGGFASSLFGLKNKNNTPEAENAKCDDKKNAARGEDPTAATNKEGKTSANKALKQQVATMQEKITARKEEMANQAETATEDNAKTESGVTAPASEEDTAASQSFMDKLKEMQNGFTNQLLEALGLGSLNENGKGCNMSAIGISAQYSLNIATTLSVMNADGSMTQSTFNFSLEASFDYLGIASGNGSGANSLLSLFGGNDKNNGLSSLFGTSESGEAGQTSFMDKLREMFSPEATAQRILDFSLSFYGRSSMFKEAGGDTDEARANFADYIGAAIQKGFDQALGILGKSINDQTSSEIDKTHELVFSGLDDFVNRREKDEKTDSSNNNNKPLEGYSSSKDGLYGNLQYFASSLSISYSSSTTYYSADEVRQLRGNAANPYANAAPSQGNSSVGATQNATDGDSLNMTV